MKITSKHQMKKCPACGSQHLLTTGLDQMCCDCDWDNSRLLIQLGQFDQLGQAALDYIKEKSFKDLEREEKKAKQDLSHVRFNPFNLTA